MSYDLLPVFIKVRVLTSTQGRAVPESNQHIEFRRFVSSPLNERRIIWLVHRATISEFPGKSRKVCQLTYRPEMDAGRGIAPRSNELMRLIGSTWPSCVKWRRVIESNYPLVLDMEYWLLFEIFADFVFYVCYHCTNPANSLEKPLQSD